MPARFRRRARGQSVSNAAWAISSSLQPRSQGLAASYRLGCSRLDGPSDPLTKAPEKPRMRTLKTTFALALLSTALLAQSPTLHGIQTADLDRKVPPCTDFFEFANGAWRAANPIPASMNRWSRRWQAGDNAKGNLKE